MSIKEILDDIEELIESIDTLQQLPDCDCINEKTTPIIEKCWKTLYILQELVNYSIKVIEKFQ